MILLQEARNEQGKRGGRIPGGGGVGAGAGRLRSLQLEACKGAGAAKHQRNTDAAGTPRGRGCCARHAVD